MLTATKAAKFKQVRRTLLAIGTAGGALCFANPALATCVIAPGGTGTVANPGPNSTVTCTGTTTGINVAGTNPGTMVQVEGGAEVNGVASSEIRIDGSAARVIIGGGATPGPAILRDTSITVIGDSARVDIVDGSPVDQSGNAAALIFAQGSNAFISIGAGSQVTVSRAVQLHGGGPGFLGATLFLDPTATLSASSGFTASAMIFGGTDSQVFYIEGRIEANDLNPVVTLIDAGDGNDTIALTATTRFGATATSSSVPAFILRGGLGTDTLQFDNIHQSLVFDTIGIERLSVDGGIGGLSRLRGSHEFQDITVHRGQLDVFGEAALGVPGSTLNVLVDGRLRFFGTGSSVLTQQINGTGVFDYAGGSNEFATANTFGGQFVISGGTPLISNSAAFGSATVINLASVTFRDVNITNVLSGNGNYIIDGTASSLGGTNRMTGTITVQSGRLTVTDVSHLANGQVTTPAAIVIGAQGSLNLDLQSNGTLENALSGTGTLNKSSAGGMTINRSNSAYSGAVNLIGGRVFISASDALGTGTIRFSGSIVDFTNTSDIIIANTITSAPGAVAVFEKNGAGRTTLTGNNSGMTAQFALNQGIIAVNSVAALGTGGNATLGGTSGIEVNNSADETLLLRITNVIPSVGTFRKLGAGRLTIGDQFQVGTLAVDAGSLRVNQTSTAANATIASGARLDGTGRIIGNLTNNGTVAPGNSIGTLTVQGNYVHNSGSVLEIEFDANGNIDLLAVTGTATLSGGTLRFVSLGGAEGSGGTFLTATGGVTGTFANVQTVGAQLPLAVIYQPNSAIMAPSVLTARPSTFNAQFMTASDSAFGFIDRVAGSTQSPGSDKYLWMQGFAADGNRSAGGATLAYEHKGHGLAGGIVMPLGERLSVGASVGWSRSNIALGSNGGSGQQDAALGSLHLRFGSDDLALEGGGFYGSVDQDTLRNVSFNGFSASVAGATHSKLYGGFIGGQAKLAELGGWKFSLRGRASLVHQSQDGFTELGTSPLRLDVAATGVETVEVQGGFGLDRQIGRARLSLNFGGRLVDNLGNREMAVTFAASNAAVTLQGDTRSGVHGYAGAALELPLSEQVSINFGYAGQVGQTDRHEGRAGLQVSF
jgi:autotransporter-associated beta strand protein